MATTRHTWRRCPAELENMMIIAEIHVIASLPVWLAGILIVCCLIGEAVLVEFVARRLIPLRLRRDHNDVSVAMFTVIGTTYTVLLAFVAMLAWKGFSKAHSVTSLEASLVRNVYQLLDGLYARRCR